MRKKYYRLKWYLSLWFRLKPGEYESYAEHEKCNVSIIHKQYLFAFFKSLIDDSAPKYEVEHGKFNQESPMETILALIKKYVGQKSYAVLCFGSMNAILAGLSGNELKTPI